jgi:hypothetical protein
MDITGIGAAADAVSSIINHFFPDKTQEEKDRLALEMQGVMNARNLTLAQLDIDKAEAQSSDPLQHWRGALGWVCVAAFAWHYVGLPVFQYGAAALVSYGWAKAIPAPPDLNYGELTTILYAMLGIGTLHAGQMIADTLTSNKQK